MLVVVLWEGPDKEKKRKEKNTLLSKMRDTRET
jgi:hypothetical protein